LPPHPGTACRDAECGEFCYELDGDAGLPAPLAEHRAQLLPGGSNLCELPLPFVNHQLEAAKRLFQVNHRPHLAGAGWSNSCKAHEGQRSLMQAIALNGAHGMRWRAASAAAIQLP
jgi:hypothetical protein